MKNTLILAYETEQSCAARLRATGVSDARAAEIAFYLAQSTDILPEFPAIERACAERDIIFAPVEIASVADVISQTVPTAAALWLLTDGIDYYNGSFAVAAASAARMPRIGSEQSLFFLAQDKFRSTAVMRELGLPVPNTVLTRNGIPLSPKPPEACEHGYFVKPNRLGAKIGISDDAHVETFEEALQISRRIFRDYRDDAVVQTYVFGRNIRASFLDVTAGGGVDPLGLYEVDSGSDFQSMTESFALQGKQSAERISPNPALQNLQLTNPDHAETLKAMAGTLMAGLGLKSVFSLDFRLTSEGEACLLEFEVCPGLPCFDFCHYLRDRWDMALPEAMAVAASSFFSNQKS